MLGLGVALVGGIVIEMILQAAELAISIARGTLLLAWELLAILYEGTRLLIDLALWRFWRWNMKRKISRI